jgi:hypothetical protein
MSVHAAGGACLLAIVVATPSLAFAQRIDPLTQARTFYNQRNFAAAVKAADEARALPGRADSADLVAARAYLERYRETASVDDLVDGRERLRRLDPQRLTPRERTEFIVGLGEALYFDGSYGAAADIFDSLLRSSSGGLTAPMREAVLDWWATAVDRDARMRDGDERLERYRRIRDRMAIEMAAQPGSTAAAYWLTAAAGGLGDLQGAWDAAEAAWVRAPMAIDRGAALRADIDRLVVSGLIPGRAKALGRPVDEVLQEWQAFKEKWTR